MSLDTLETEPIGWYFPDEVGRLAGVSGRQIGQWARYGYMKSAWALESPRAYAFQDVAEAMVLHYLVDHRVPYRSIRAAVDAASERYGVRWPLSTANLYIVADHPQSRGPRKTVVVDDYDVASHHPVLGTLELAEVKRDLAHGGWAAREHPELRHVQVDPAIRGGQPVIRGTRVPVELVAELAEREDGHRQLWVDYGISMEQAHDAVVWMATVRTYEDN